MQHAATLRAGHTLIELLVTLGTVAIIATAAGPSFAAWLLDLRRDATVSSSLHAIHMARQLAAVRGENVSLCGSRAGLTCSDACRQRLAYLRRKGERPPHAA